MKWIYPNFLQKIDHYLKINYPHIWRTRVHDFAWFSLILGNGLAVALGILMVAKEHILSQGTMAMLHFGGAIMLCFVGLFWAMKLLRFKVKLSNFKTMLTTWLIYVLCIGSLGLNLATFTATIAYQTSYLYSDKVVQADYETLNLVSNYNLYTNSEDHHYQNYLSDEYHTDELINTMARHGYMFKEHDKIYRYQVNDVRSKVRMLKEAKVFVWQPIQLNKSKDNYDYDEKRSIHHDLFQIHWIVGIIMLFFLPALLFLLSTFGVRNVLISIFSTAIMIGSTTMIAGLLGLLRHYGEEQLTATYAIMTFILAMILVAGSRRLKSWNYIAGVFMLMLGATFFAFFCMYVDEYHYTRNPLLLTMEMLPISLLVSLTAAWAIAKRNALPVSQ